MAGGGEGEGAPSLHLSERHPERTVQKEMENSNKQK